MSPIKSLLVMFLALATFACNADGMSDLGKARLAKIEAADPMNLCFNELDGTATRNVMIDSSYSAVHVSLILHNLSVIENALDGQVHLVPSINSGMTDSFESCKIKVINTLPKMDPTVDAQHKDGWTLADTRSNGNGVGRGTASAVIRLPEALPKVDPADELIWQFSALHEMLHSVGMNHVHYEDYVSIMEPFYSPDQVFGETDIATLNSIWEYRQY